MLYKQTTVVSMSTQGAIVHELPLKEGIVVDSLVPEHRKSYYRLVCCTWASHRSTPLQVTASQSQIFPHDRQRDQRLLYSIVVSWLPHHCATVEPLLTRQSFVANSRHTFTEFHPGSTQGHTNVPDLLISYSVSNQFQQKTNKQQMQ